MTYKKQRNVKERNVDFLFPKCQTHTYTWFENGCSENSAQKLRTKYSTEENNKHRTQDLWHSFSQYGLAGKEHICN